MCIFQKEYIRLNVCFTFKVLLLVGSEQKPTVRKASSKDEDGNDTEQMCFTFPKCFSLLDKNKTEQIELIMFCNFDDAGDYQIGHKMTPALVCGELTWKNIENKKVAVIVTDYCEIIPSTVTSEDAIRMFSEETAVCQNLLAKDKLTCIPRKRLYSELSPLAGVPRPLSLRKVA